MFWLRNKKIIVQGLTDLGTNVPKIISRMQLTIDVCNLKPAQEQCDRQMTSVI